MRVTSAVVVGALACLSALAPGAEPPSVPLTVSEPAGVRRQAEPASGGVPFKKGQVKSVDELALFDKEGQPVPAQFAKLAGYEDGSVQWALVDVIVPELPAGGEVGYVLKPGQAATPKTALKTEETDAKVVFDTGTVSFTVNKQEFNLFDDVTLGGKKIVTGSAVELLNCELGERDVKVEGNRDAKVVGMKEGGQIFTCKTGKPTRAKWEYRGPVRATLRVDGDYLGDGPKLSYTTRITAWAGSATVRVEHSIRNSNPAAGSDAYIKRAAITLKLGFSAKGQAHEVPKTIFGVEPPKAPIPGSKPGDYDAQGCDDWCSGGDGAVGLMIQDRHTGGVYRGPGTYLRKVIGCGWSQSWPGLFVQSVEGDKAVVELVSAGPKLEGKGAEQGALGFTSDGTFALADRAHKDSEVWFDFYTGERAVADNQARAKACRSKLLLVAPGEWYSETEALGIGHFGTRADEIACYRAWGWAGWDDPKKQFRVPHQPFAFVPAERIHDVSEDDAVEGYLLQFLRTGDRGCFDWAEAYAGFFRSHAVLRNDWGERWGTPAPGARTGTGMGFGWYGPRYHDWADTRMHYCHQYGRGLLDHYCLTGSTDSLEAGLDLAAEVSAGWERAKPGGGVYLGRTFGRQFNTVLRAWQLTREAQWKKVADNWAEYILKGSNWDAANGFYRQSFGGNFSYFSRDWYEAPPGGKFVVPQRMLDYLAKNGIKAARAPMGGADAVVGTKGDQKWEIYVLPQIFELSECHQAMERYGRLMDSEPMKKRLVELTRGVIKLYWCEKCQFMRDSGYFGWPEKDQVLDGWSWQESHDKCPADPGGTHAGYSTRYIADMCARAYSHCGDRSLLDWARKCWDRGSKRPYNQDRQSAGEKEVGEFAYIRGAHRDTVLECSSRLFYEATRAK